MILYRVESTDGFGPFCEHRSEREDYERHGVSKDDALWHGGPAPSVEAHRMRLYTFALSGRVCGVTSTLLLATWFPRPQVLALLGYSLTIWEADDDEADAFRYQAVFTRESARLLARHPIPVDADGWAWVDTL